MIVRTAVLEGTVAEADRAGFDHHMRAVVIPAIGRYPGIRQVKLRQSAEAEAGAPHVYMCFDLYFDDLAAIHAALASPIRQEVRGLIQQGMGAFSGRVYHLIQQED